MNWPTTLANITEKKARPQGLRPSLLAVNNL
jgi:hypothetical protein